MSVATYHTYDEIRSQTRAWAQALNVAASLGLPKAEDYAHVVFTGCGSTYYLSLSAAAVYQELTGRTARAVPGSELLLNSQVVLTNERTLLVAISRSGTTTETVRAVEKFRKEERGDVLAIGNYDATLMRLADVSAVIEAGQEESIAQTRSFASMFVLASALAARMASRNELLGSMAALPGLGEKLIARYESRAKEIGSSLGFDRFYFLGSGIRHGLACEVNLKMKEMTLTHSEPFHFLEFRHGPISMVNKDAVVVGMLSDANRAHEDKVLADVEHYGGTVLSLGESGADVSFESGIPESVRGVLYLPVLQLMAYYRALEKGMNPDKPHNLTAVVTLDL